MNIAKPQSKQLYTVKEREKWKKVFQEKETKTLLSTSTAIDLNTLVHDKGLGKSSNTKENANASIDENERPKPDTKSLAKRGSLLEFFDTDITERLYQKSQREKFMTKSESEKKFIAASVDKGKLIIDEDFLRQETVNGKLL